MTVIYTVSIIYLKSAVKCGYNAGSLILLAFLPVFSEKDRMVILGKVESFFTCKNQRRKGKCSFFFNKRESVQVTICTNLEYFNKNLLYSSSSEVKICDPPPYFSPESLTGKVHVSNYR